MTGKTITAKTYSTADCSGAILKTLTFSSGACVASTLYNSGQETVTYVAPVAPKLAESPSSGSSKSSCFAGDESVLLESGDIKAISKVRVGDRVLTATFGGDQVFSEVPLPSDYDSPHSSFYKQENFHGIFMNWEQMISSHFLVYQFIRLAH